MAALLLAGAACGFMPRGSGGIVTAGLCVLGALICLPPLLIALPATALDLPIGPPGLSLHLALDPVSVFFLLLAFASGAAVAAFQAAKAPMAGASEARVAAVCLAGTSLTLLAADAMSLAIGAALAGGPLFLQRKDRRGHIILLIPLLLLSAICLLAPDGSAPRFDAIRDTPIAPGQAMAAASLTAAAVIVMLCYPRATRCETRDALTAGALLPAGCYLLLRVVVDLCGSELQGWWPLGLLLLGGCLAALGAWGAARQPDIDKSVVGLIQRQAGLVMVGIALALLARAADLPEAQSAALATVMLLAIASSFAGVLATLAAHAIGLHAGAYRLSHLGGLAHMMPMVSGLLAVGLLGLSALPPGIGFACLWLAFQSILTSPRTGGLMAQLPLALAVAGLALSAAIAGTASARLIGVASLGRPRLPRSVVHESNLPARAILLTLAGFSTATGLLPGPALWILAGPAMLAVTDVQPRVPSYLTLPMLALLAVVTGGIMLLLRWRRREPRTVGPWMQGMDPPDGLPYGEPAAQASAIGFLPELPGIPLPKLPLVPAFPPLGRLSPTAAFCMILGGFGLLLLLLGVTG